MLAITLCACSSEEAPAPAPTKSIVKAPALGEEILFENAVRAYDRGLFSIALESFTELRDGYPASYFSTLAELKIADCKFNAGDYPSALTAYEEFAKMHPGHEAMPYVRFQIGNSSLEQYRGTEREQAPLLVAVRSFQQVIDNYPDSEWSLLSRRRLDQCREHLAAYEEHVAAFYRKRGFENASHARLMRLNSEFPESRAVESAQETFGQLPAPGRAAGGTAPPAPVFIAAEQASYHEQLSRVRPHGRVEEESLLLAREKDSAERTKSVIGQKLPSAIAPVLVGLECDDEARVATLRIEDSFILRSKNSVPGGTTLSFESGSPIDSEFQLREPEAFECTLDHVSIHAVEGIESSHRRIVVTVSAAEGIEALLLDRPKRIALILPSASTTN